MISFSETTIVGDSSIPGVVNVGDSSIPGVVNVGDSEIPDFANVNFSGCAVVGDTGIELICRSFMATDTINFSSSSSSPSIMSLVLMSSPVS